MKVIALRGVCIGPEQHLAVGDEADVDKATAHYLESIKAVEIAPEPVSAPGEADAEVDPKQAPVKAGKKGK